MSNDQTNPYPAGSGSDDPRGSSDSIPGATGAHSGSRPDSPRAPASTPPDAHTWSPIVGSDPYQTHAGSAHDQASAGLRPAWQPSAGGAPRTNPSGVAVQPNALTRPPRQRRAGLLVVAAALSAVIGAGAGIGAYTVADGDTPATTLTVSNAPAAQAAVLDGTVAAAAAKITPSTVTITVEGRGSADIGTGVVLDTAGHIVTNDHVVSSAASGGKITVTLFDGTVGTARVVGESPSYDLAVIKIDSGVERSKLKPAVFATSSSVTLGQAVVAVGAPLGLADTVTSGVVSTTARAVRSGDNNDAVYLAVQTDTAINPGNSGGPLVNLNGAVIGINSSIASTATQQTGQQAGNIGIGFAIPADVVTRVAADLVNTGKAADASLGVTVRGTDSLTDNTTSKGVALASVQRGSAADRAGLVAGDVVTKVNQHQTTTADSLIAAIRFYPPGTSVTVSYLRGGTEQTAQVTLGTA